MSAAPKNPASQEPFRPRKHANAYGAESGKSTKIRLDLLIFERDFAESVSAAAAMIMAGEVTTENKILSKPGQSVPIDIVLNVKKPSPYVSRGADKLASVADKLGLNFKDTAILDVGSSTGGFTDYALQNGAKKSYAVDVGYGQLAWRLIQDPRVVSMERTDIRELASLPSRVDYVLIDASFISLTKILDSTVKFLKKDGLIVAMAKPQFEATRALATKYKGVIKDENLRVQILKDLVDKISDRFDVVGEDDSSTHGASGNIERFYLLKPKISTKD